MKKIVIAGGVVAFILMVVLISSLSMKDDALSHDDGHIPDNIGAFYSVNEIEGEEANQIINQLYGRKVKFDADYVVEYQTNGASYALVYISESDQEGELAKLYEEVKQKIEASTAYSNQSEKKINDKVVQYASERERDNYYFVSDNRIIWIVTFEDKNDRFIKNAVKIF